MKKIYLFIALAFVFISATAQFNENWGHLLQATTALNYSNEGRKVVTDVNSNVFMVGDYSSDKDSSGHGAATTQYSVRIYKYDYNGNLLTWAYIPVGGLITTGYENKSAFGLELDAAGNVYVGYSVLNAQGNYDVVLASYSNNLIRNWAKTYATANNDAGVDMKLSGNAAIAIVKSTGANTIYSVVRATNVGTTAALVYSFTPNTDVVNSLVVAGTKSYHMTGHSIVSGTKVAMIASVSPAGSLKWKSTYNHGSTTGDDYSSKILLGNDGYLYTIGTTYTSVANGNDGMVLKYNISGGLVAFVLLHNSTTDVGGCVANGPANFIFASCSNTSVVSVYKIATAGQFTAIATATYLPTPTNSYISITNISIADMKVAASNNVYVSGTVEGTSASGNFSGSLLGKFGLNGFLFKLLKFQPFVADFNDNYRSVAMGLDGYKNDILLLRNQWGNNTNHATEMVDVSDLDGGASLRLAHEGVVNPSVLPGISLYPNPASEVITVNCDEKISSLEISDLTGNIVRTVKVNALEMKIQISDLNKGLYICNIVTESGSTMLKKFIIE